MRRLVGAQKVKDLKIDIDDSDPERVLLNGKAFIQEAQCQLIRASGYPALVIQLRIDRDGFADKPDGIFAVVLLHHG